MLTMDEEAQEGIEQLITDLRTARDLIERGGLSKGQMYRDSGFLHSPYAYCTVGAVLEVTDKSSAWAPGIRASRALFALAETLGCGSYSYTDRRAALYEFNDNDITATKDVLGLFDMTIHRLGG